MSQPRAESTAASPLAVLPSMEKAGTNLGSVMVTGVGGIVGQGVIKCLMDTRFPVVGVDASEMAAGLYAVPKGYIVPPSMDPSWVDRLLDICAGESVRYLFLGLDMELPIISRAAARFKKAGVIPIVSSPSVIDLADDKLETVRFLQSQGLPAPRTSDLADGYFREFGFPLVLKPRKGGSRSQGLYIVSSEEELRDRLRMIDRANCVVQEFIEGDEYTCGTINFDGKCLGVMAMRRTLRDGDTHKAFVVRDPIIESHVRKVAEILKPFGPCNFQLKLRDGTPYIFEINPRCSGGSYIRALAGFNEPMMTLDFLEQGTPPAYEIRPVSILRYWKEIVVESQRVEEVRLTGAVRNNVRRL